MVAMDRYESESGEHSYKYKMKQVVVDLKAKPLIRREKENWDMTDKACRDGRKIIWSIIKKWKKYQ